MIRPIPLVDLARQHAELRDELLAAVAAVVDAGMFVGGPAVDRFEANMATWLRVGHAIGVSNGTAAIELVLEALGVGPGDEVVLPTLTFVATAEAVCAVGARPVLVDIDPATYQIDPAAAEAALTDRSRALLPVHLHGLVAPMGELLALARARDLVVVEDAAQAHGATWDERAVGTLGDAGTFSFYPGKNLGALGDAGMVVTDRADVAERVRSRRDHGRRSKHEHDLIGRNERLDAIQAAMLDVKLAHVDRWNVRRRELAGRYDEHLRPAGLRVVAAGRDAEAVHHVYAIEVANRDDVAAALAAAGIASGIHYPLPVHLQPAFRSFGRGEGSLPEAERVASRLLSLPLSPELADDELERVVTTVLGVARP